MILKALTGKRSLNSLKKYLEQDGKTAGSLIAGYCVDPKEFPEQFITVQEIYEKTDGIRYHHFIQSLTPEETKNADPLKVNKLGQALAYKQFGKKGFQYVVITHIDTDHIHNHIIVNSVNMNTGKKLHENKFTLAVNKKVSNDLSTKTGFSTINLVSKSKKKTNSEYWLEKKGEEPWKESIRKAIDTIKTKVTNYIQFKSELQNLHQIKATRDNGKGITYVDNEGHKVRGKKLGTDYDKEAIMAYFENRQKKAHKHSLKITFQRNKGKSFSR